MNTRIPFTRLPALAVISASLALAACAGEAEDAAEEADAIGESIDGVAEGDALDGEEITEAVPGVVEAEPEGETPNTADLSDQENAEYTDDADGYE